MSESCHYSKIELESLSLHLAPVIELKSDVVHERVLVTSSSLTERLTMLARLIVLQSHNSWLHMKELED